MAAFVRAYANLLPPESCRAATALAEGALATTPEVPALRIDDRPAWADVTLALHAGVLRALAAYAEDCPTFAAVHPRVAAVGYVIGRRATGETTSFRAPTTLRPRPPLLVLGWLSGDAGTVEFEAQPDVIAAVPGTIAIIPTGWEYVYRETAARSLAYVLTTAFTYAADGTRA